MGMDAIRSRLRAKKSSDGQSKPPYPQSKYDDNTFVWKPPMSTGDPPNILNSLGLSGVSDMWSHLNSVNTEKELMAQQLQAAQLQAAQAGSWTPSVTPPTTRAQMASRAREMFLKRMGGIRAELKIAESDFLQCHVDGDTVYLFYCFGGRDGCVKENIDMFPSDQLITQFRMVLAAT